MKKPKRLVVVSNRLPIVVDQQNDHWEIQAGSGGLVTALAPILQNQSGLWIGWPGCGEEAPLDDLFERFGREHNYDLHAVPLTEQEVEKYYLGFSNETLWPLLHDLLGHCHFSQENWLAYAAVNRRFAESVAGIATADDLIWVHDYQLALVGFHLRQLGVGQPLAFFLHTPFPAPDMLRRLPWKAEWLRALLNYDLLGFQTLRDRRNFVNGVTTLLPDTEVLSRHRYYTLLRWGQRQVKAGHFPISIDFDRFDTDARSQQVADAAWQLHEHFEGRKMVLGIDRLDYTKGIPERLLAFERALEKYPELHANISLIQVVIPSRVLIPEYQALKAELEGLAGRINGRFGDPGWVPVHYQYRSLDRTQLLACYRTSEIALITPLRDGMNLVAKEYCACSVDRDGVLILSEFAGAADELGKYSLLVNPYDLEETADAIYQAFTMGKAERQRRMVHLRATIRRNDVHRWVNWFLAEIRRDSPDEGARTAQSGRQRP
jgi:trehalose 6-phosphate synthase